MENPKTANNQGGSTGQQMGGVKRKQIEGHI
jgi:hypothetical protein